MIKPIKPDRVLDLHTHLFNLRYMPLEEILNNFFGTTNSPFAKNLANLLWEITSTSYYSKTTSSTINLSPIEEMWEIIEYELKKTIKSLDIDQTELLEIKLSPSENTELFSKINKSDLLSSLIDLSEINHEEEEYFQGLQYEFPQPEINLIVNLPDSFSYAYFLDFLKSKVTQALEILKYNIDKSFLGDIGDGIEFFLTLIRSEEEILQKLNQGYENFGFDFQFSHYLIDMEKSFNLPNNKPYYDFHKSQENKMQELQKNHPNQIIGFSSFDPRRGKDWNKLAKESIKKGFCGFKFYPAMGYRPDFNNDPNIQKYMDEFISYCEEENIPIFAHCTPTGFQTKAKNGNYAHPYYWKSVLEKHKNLILCFGHAGGGLVKSEDKTYYGWIAKNNMDWTSMDNYANIVAELCISYPNVFCEFGYLHDLIDNPTMQQDFIKNLKRYYKKGNTYNLFEKIAYGSDWHMPFIVDNTEKYLNMFLDIFNSHFPEHIDDFFWKNGYKFLNSKNPSFTEK